MLGELRKELLDLNAMMIEGKNQRQQHEGKLKFSELGEPSVGDLHTPNSNHLKGFIEFGDSSERGHVEEVHFQIRKHKNLNRATCMCDEGMVLGCVSRVLQ